MSHTDVKCAALAGIQELDLARTSGMAVYTGEAIVGRIKAGMEAAKANGKHLRRPRNEKRLRRIRKMRDDRLTVIDIADRLKCSRQAVYQALAKTAHID